MARLLERDRRRARASAGCCTVDRRTPDRKRALRRPFRRTPPRAVLDSVRGRSGPLSAGMRAQILDRSGGPLTLREIADPPCGDGQVRVSVSACAVCRTDLHVLDEELTRPK